MDQRLLINRWLAGYPDPLPILDAASVSLARERVREMGRSLGLTTEIIESVAIVASELATNQLRHARHGRLAVRATRRGSVPGIEVIAVDRGPGLPSLERPKVAQHGPLDGLGAGLAAVRRLSDEVDFDVRLLQGTAITARRFAEPMPAFAEVAIVGRPYPGEAVSGDDGIAVRTETGLVVAVADGLGHGLPAHEASGRAMAIVLERPDESIPALVGGIHEGLSGTRGCALALARFERASRRLHGACVGDVSMHLYERRQASYFASTAQTLGDTRRPLRRLLDEERSIEPGAVLVLFSDGLTTHATLKDELDVLRRTPLSIAHHLLAEFARDNDDALVLVARLHHAERPAARPLP